MDVYECIMFGDPTQEVVSKDLAYYVETAIKDHKAFTIRIIAKGIDPRKNNWAIGFYPPYGMAFISNPDSSRGLSAIDITNRRLVFNRNEPAFHNQRDSCVYIRPGNTYVLKPYQDVLKEFLAKGYTIVEFAPQHPGDHITRHSTVLHRNPAELPFGKALSIDALL